ncbi:hypothetical protein U1Q18_006969 [Sarracenia purpurea var. burkii]
MYFNKVGALREKVVAEKMINGNDYVSARDKLLKAQQLFPALDHIVAMLTVCDILSASKLKIPGYNVDYYWVLHLMPSSSLSDIRCRYQKLLNLLQPIKNKFPGTEVALRLIEDAFSVLADTQKRIEFDLKRETSWEGYESVNVSVSSGEIMEGKNGIGLVTEMLPKSISDLEPQLEANHNIGKHHIDVISLQEPSACSSNMVSEGNTAEEIDMLVDNIDLPPELHRTSLKQTSSSLYFNVVSTEKREQDFYDFRNDRKIESFQTGQIWAAHYRSGEHQNCRYAQVNTVLKSSVTVTWLKPVPISNGERRWCDAGLPVACGPFYMDLENGEKVCSPTVFSYNCPWARGVTEQQFEIYPKKGEIWALYEGWDLDEWSYNPETIKGCKFSLVELLFDFSKYLGADVACLVKADDFKSIFQRLTKEGNPVILHISPNNLYMLSHRVPAYRFTGGEIDGATKGMFELDQLALPNETTNDMDSQITSRVENSDSSLPSLPSPNPYPVSKMLGPNWSPNEFIAGQVWAVYGGKDWMPRHYARINNMRSSDQVHITYLEPQPILLDYDITRKKGSPPAACGIYGATGTSVSLEISQFSHLVRCQLSTTTVKPIYKIYPLKGEVWAMYKNWNKNWMNLDYENSQFDVVEVLSDFLEGSGMRIARLIEVKDCLTFFHRQQVDGFDLTRFVSKTEVLGFSHRILAFRVPGIGRHGIPESSWHLEPNALPYVYDPESCTVEEPVTV